MMKLNVIKYLKRNLKPDPKHDRTDEVLEYVTGLEKKAKLFDKRQEYLKTWRAKNADKTREKYAEYYKEYARKWRAAHPDYQKEYYRKLKKGLKNKKV